MSITCDTAYKSLNKFSEELCGDKVEVLKTDDSDILILADGMGSGVKANILSTLTSKILGTMFRNGATLEECVQTVMATLPICSVRKVAYSTFSILQVFRSGQAVLIEYDNPGCIFIRDGKLMDIPRKERIISGKRINEYRFEAKPGDAFLIMSDGTIHAGVGSILNFGWDWKDIAAYALKKYGRTLSAIRLAANVCEACNELYGYRPGDDTTVACMRIINRKPVHVMTGPAKDPSDDERMVRDFMSGGGEVKRVISGGTSAQIAARILNRKLDVSSIGCMDPDVPPEAEMDGVDLVTEGVLTISQALKLLKAYKNPEQVSDSFFKELDKKNGASEVAKMIIEDCTDLTVYAGLAVNEAYQNPNLPLELNIRQNLVEQFRKAAEEIGRPVKVIYY
jgi:hypothetical protein